MFSKPPKLAQSIDPNMAGESALTDEQLGISPWAGTGNWTQGDAMRSVGAPVPDVAMTHGDVEDRIMAEVAKQSIRSYQAAGQAPGQAVANAWVPPPPGGEAGGSQGPMPSMTLGLGSSSRTQGTSTTSPDISPEQAGAMNAELAAGQLSRSTATEQLGAIKQAQARDIGDAIRERDRRVRAEQARSARDLADVEERRVAQEERNDKILAGIKPNFDYYRGKYGGLRAMGDAIAIGLSGMAQGMLAAANIRAGHPGVIGPNPVLASIERAYELDMKKQLAEMADKKWKYQQGRNMLADLRQETGDIRQALALAKASYYDEASSRFEAIKAEWGGKAAPWEADVQKSLADETTKMRQRAVLASGTAKVVKTEQRTSGGHQVINPEYVARMKGGGAGQGKQLPAKVAQGLGEVEGFVKKVKDWSKEYLVEAAKMGHAASATLGGLWGSKARALEVAKGSIAAQLRSAVETGVMTKEDAVRYEKRLPTLTDSLESAKLKTNMLLKEMDQDFGSKVRGLRKSNWDVSGYPNIGGGE